MTSPLPRSPGDARADGVSTGLSRVVDGYRLLGVVTASRDGVAFAAVDSAGVECLLEMPSLVALAAPGAVDLWESRVSAAYRRANPRILAPRDSGECVGVPYVVFPRPAGWSLSTVVAASRVVDDTLSEGWIAALGVQIGEALDGFHSQGGRGARGIHGRLSPQSIYVDREGRVTVAGLGFSDGSESRLWAKPGDTEGYSWLAPEQLGEGSVEGPGADVWATSLLLLWLATGRNPYMTPSIARTVASILQGAPPPVEHPRLRGGLGRVLASGLARSPAARPADGKALAVALQALVASSDPIGAAIGAAGPTASDWRAWFGRLALQGRATLATDPTLASSTFVSALMERLVHPVSPRLATPPSVQPAPVILEDVPEARSSSAAAPPGDEEEEATTIGPRPAELQELLAGLRANGPAHGDVVSDEYILAESSLIRTALAPPSVDGAAAAAFDRAMESAPLDQDEEATTIAPMPTRSAVDDFDDSPPVRQLTPAPAAPPGPPLAAQPAVAPAPMRLPTEAAPPVPSPKPKAGGPPLGAVILVVAGVSVAVLAWLWSRFAGG